MSNTLLLLIGTPIALCIGFLLWYVYYGLECYLNSFSPNGGLRNMHLPFLWNEICYLIPQLRKDKSKVYHPSFPGPIHFVFTHIIIPLFPLSVFLIHVFYFR